MQNKSQRINERNVRIMYHKKALFTTKRIIGILCMIIFTAVLLSGCARKKNSIKGKWECIQSGRYSNYSNYSDSWLQSYIPKEFSEGDIIEFTDEGTFLYWGQLNIPYVASWSEEGKYGYATIEGDVQGKSESVAIKYTFGDSGEMYFDHSNGFSNTGYPVFKKIR